MTLKALARFLRATANRRRRTAARRATLALDDRLRADIGLGPRLTVAAPPFHLCR